MEIPPANIGISIPLESPGDEAKQYQLQRASVGIAYAQDIADTQPLKAERLVRCAELSLPLRQELQSLLRQRS